MDTPVAMDVDYDDAVATTSLSGSKDNSSLPAETHQLLTAVGAAADASDAKQLDVSATPGAASLAYQPKPNSTVVLAPAGAAMADADDPGEDDVDLLQPDDYEYDDDVTPVAGDILGLGPTWGTVAGDPTSNLGRLGPELVAAMTNFDGKAAGDSAAPAPGKDGGESRSKWQQQGGARSAALLQAAAAGEGGVGGTMSEGDADIRGRRVGAVNEDVDLPARGAEAAVEGGSGTGGESPPSEPPTAAAAADEDTVGVGEGPAEDLYEDDPEYPPGYDVLDAGDIAAGKFRSQPYLRSRSAGQAGIDPDPRLRPEPDPRKGLSLEGDMPTSHAVQKRDFAMGTVAVPELVAAGAVGNVRGLEYTDEPKYTEEVDVGGLQDRVSGGGSGSAENDAGLLAEVDDVGRVAGSTAVEGSGPVLLQQVGVESVQQRGLADATAAQPTAATDARHLGAIFGESDGFST